MILTIKDVEKFRDDNYELLKTNLREQIQKHFILIVEAIPTIKSIEWTSSQEDEMMFSLKNLKIIKTNGYFFEYYYYAGNNKLSKEEFNNEEIELILAFQTYLNSLSKIIVNLWGDSSFLLELQEIKTIALTLKKM